MSSFSMNLERDGMQTPPLVAVWEVEAAMSSPVRRILEPFSSPARAQPSWMDLPGSTTQQQVIEALEAARRDAGELMTQMRRARGFFRTQDLGTPPRKVRKKDADTPEVATPPSLKRYSLERQRQWYRKKLASLEENLGQDGAALSKEATASSSISSARADNMHL